MYSIKIFAFSKWRISGSTRIFIISPTGILIITITVTTAIFIMFVLPSTILFSSICAFTVSLTMVGGVIVLAVISVVQLLKELCVMHFLCYHWFQGLELVRCCMQRFMHNMPIMVNQIIVVSMRDCSAQKNDIQLHSILLDIIPQLLLSCTEHLVHTLVVL